MGILRENPVLEKEVRGRLRAKRQSKASRIAGFVVTGLVVLLLYYFGVSSILGSNSAGAAESLFIFFSIGIEMTLIVFLAPALTAGAITQEREQQTWNALLLTRLTAPEIVGGKFVAALLPPILALLVFAPLNLLAAVVGRVGLGTYLLSSLILLATIVFCTALSLFFSWMYRRTYVATAASFGATAFLTVGTLVTYGMFETANYGGHSDPETFPVMWLNPYLALWVALDKNNKHISASYAYLLLTAFLSALLLTVVTRRLSLGPKELEQ